MTDLIYHEFEDCLWIRCSSRGSFINSPGLKSIAEKYMDAGGSRVVVDLELCPGVDSTFMGTLAGLARRCLAIGGSMEVAEPTARTRAAMESLGLDMLLEIDPPTADWKADLTERRAALTQHTEALPEQQPALTEADRTRHVLEAHNTLRTMNKKNDEVFGYVCETLEEDLKRHESDQDSTAP